MGVTYTYATATQRTLKNSNFYDQGRTQSLLFGPTLTPIYPLKMAQIEKSKYFQGKHLSIGLSNPRNSYKASLPEIL